MQCSAVQLSFSVRRVLHRQGSAGREQEFVLLGARVQVAPHPPVLVRQIRLDIGAANQIARRPANTNWCVQAHTDLLRAQGTQRSIFT